MAKAQEQKQGTLGKALKLFFLIFVVLLIPVILDQLGEDAEAVRTVGRISLGVAVLFFVYGVVSKLFKALALVVLALIATVALVSEDQIELPKIRQMFSSSK